ncbi:MULTISPECIES: arylamine N-acetyltransferase [Streptacidiphilus]|uniref:Arylamine N-acetyltransferase n=1 Tax=Streptacidiphilus cavernicola TaxID=3342716 RepID=A0ABV6UQT1_9ACTN|nr:arylamine N-acetyltransferase [Streptacidiphilus jeojiense]
MGTVDQPADEWQNDLLDLDAYLKRIGLDRTGGLAADAATLTALHRAHVAAIPFENLALMLDQPVRTDLGSVQDKLVHQGRGGYCYEQNTLFGAVLQRLGFRVDRLLARVGSDSEALRPRTHMTLSVEVDGRRLLADTGFGNGLLEPIPLDPDGPQPQGVWTYRTLGPDRDGVRRFQELDAGQWQTRYRFTDEPQHAVDVVMSNHYTTTWPSSPFRQRPIVVRREAGSSRELIGRRFSRMVPGRPAESVELTDAAVVAALREEFRLDLTPEEGAVLTARLTPRQQP